MSLNNEQLRLGIIGKLKEYNAYIDNELPDYIMVMLANKKTFLQINNDLQLFLGSNTNHFTGWLQKAIANPDTLMKKGEDTSEVEIIRVEDKGQAKKKAARGERESPDSEKNSAAHSDKKTSAGSGTKRRRSEDALELHPTIDWEEEDGGEDAEKPSPRKLARKSGAVESKVIRTSTVEFAKGEKEEKGRVKKVGVAGDGEHKEEDTHSSRAALSIKHLSKSQDLRVLIARKKGERSAPPTYISSSRHSVSEEESGGEEGEEEEEEGGRKGGVSSVIKVPERTHMSIEGGSRLLQRAIKGLAPVEREKKVPRLNIKERLGPPVRGREQGGVRREVRREGREEEGQKGRDATERVGERRKKVSGIHEHVQEATVKEQDGEGEVEVEMLEEETVEEDGEEKQEPHEEIHVDTPSLTVEGQGHSAQSKATPTSPSSGDDTTQKVEQAVMAALRKVLPAKRELSDLRELITRHRKGEKEEGTEFVVTMDGVEDRYLHLDEEEDDETVSKPKGQDKRDEEEVPSRGSGMPERCRFWPNCKNGDSCPFHHPSAQCRMFPNCKYGNKCLFIHPQCKFDSRCTRSDCPYLHTAPRHVVPRGPLPASPPVFPPSFSPVPQYPKTMWSQRSQKFPNKSALTWTPGKQQISERQFAVPEEKTTSMPVK